MNSVATMFNNEEIKSIRAVREIESINKLPFYYPQEEELRMELVYEAGRRILPWDTGKDTAILDSLPIVLVSGRPAEDVLPESVRERVKLRLVDVYDNNARKKNTKWHSPKFVRYVTVIEKR